MEFKQAIEARRSIYALGNDAAMSSEGIREIIEHAVAHAPTAFHSQTGRIALLFGEQSKKFWRLTGEALQREMGGRDFTATGQKMEAFAAGLGTVLFFEDRKGVRALQSQFPLYADKFPMYADHSSGMLQYIVWTRFAENGIGASLQHYQPLVDAFVQREWNIPDEWELKAQMPFGSIAAPAGEKEIAPLDMRVRVFGDR